jgi:AraC-like DNA-binding protein
MASMPPIRPDPLAEPYFAARKELDAYDTFATHRLGQSRLVAARFRRDRPDLGVTLPNERRDELMAVVNLRPQRANDVWCENVHARRGDLPTGALAVLDHRQSWTARIDEPLETVHVFVPVADLKELGRDIGHKTEIDTLHCPITAPTQDVVMFHLALALLPAIENPHQVSTLFADHIYGAIRLHLAINYGGLVVPEEQSRGGLAPWQERLVKDLLLDDLASDTSLSELARACGISSRHFTRAFRATNGLPPHRWLLQRRVERAKFLLENSSSGISEIARECGFADQSHLTRLFRQLIGTTPAAWRRSRRS